MGGIQTMLEPLRDIVLRHAGSHFSETVVPRLSLSLVREPSSGTSTVDGPVICLILQGSKRVTIGDEVLHYDSASYFIASLDLPVMGEIRDVSPDRPYVAVGLMLDRAVLADMIAHAPPGVVDAPLPEGDRPSFAVSGVTTDLVAAWGGLLALLDTPDDAPMLAPLRERELLYRLLRGPLGAMLRQLAQEDGRLARIRRSIDWIRAHFDAPLRVAALAEIAGMSVTSYHRHFKASTAISPLQYQKLLRLHAARRQLASGMEASQAAYSVGYESTSQFSREYRRTFGIPPSRDGARLERYQH